MVAGVVGRGMVFVVGVVVVVVVGGGSGDVSGDVGGVRVSVGVAGISVVGWYDCCFMVISTRVNEG